MLIGWIVIENSAIWKSNRTKAGSWKGREKRQPKIIELFNDCKTQYEFATTSKNSYLCILAPRHSIFPPRILKPVDQSACNFYGT